MNNNNNRNRRMTDHQQKNYDDRVRLGHLEREMGGIKGEVGLLKVAMTDNSAKLTGMQDQMLAISRSLEKMADRVHEPKSVNWGWLISGVMGVLLIAGGYTQVVTDPLKADAERSYQIVRQAEERAQDIERRLSYQEGFAAGAATAGRE
jgi:hypothetical protein